MIVILKAGLWLICSGRRTQRVSTSIGEAKLPLEALVLLLYTGGGGRTHTMLPPLDFESSTSACSVTPACLPNSDSDKPTVVIIAQFFDFVK